MGKITYKTAETGLEAQCEAVLRTVPQWFGIEESLLDYVKKITELDTYSAWDGSDLIGFMSVLYHNDKSAELYVLAIKAAYHRQGIGTHLYSIIERELKEKGVRFVQVKTVDESAGDENYDKTRQFYSRLGFLPLEVFPELWGENNPCLQMVKNI